MKKVLLFFLAAFVCFGVARSQDPLAGMRIDTVYTDDGTILGYPVGGTTYRVYAQLEASTNFFSSMFATLEIPGDTPARTFDINSDNGFWNSAFGNEFGNAINAAFFPLAPDLQYDSWLTIGMDNSLAPGALGNAATPSTIFADSFGAAAGAAGPDLNMTDGLIFATQPNANGFGVAHLNGDGTTTYDVLLMQITTTGDWSYCINVQTFNSVGGGGPEGIYDYAWDSANFPDVVPGTPGSYNGYCKGLCSSAFGDAACDPVTDVPGCMDTTACNYDSLATIDDGSCTYPGCNDSTACNYDSTAGCDDGSCDYLDACGVCGGGGTVAGCTDSTACNYDSTADCDDSSCQYLDACGVCGGAGTVAGCTDSTACNYDSTADCDDSSCQYLDACGVCGGAGTVAGCTDSTACNYDSTADCDDSSCQYLDACGVCGGAGTVAGCTDSTACNYDSTADCDDSSCQYLDACGVCGGAGTVAGCTDSTACNYDSTADCDDSSCQYLDACGVCGGAGTVAGCTDSTACNYDSTADCDDSSCQYLDACGVCGGAGTVAGCTDSTACNYDSTADCDDSSCQYLDACGVCGGAGTVAGCTDSTACNYDSTADCDDSSCQYLDACGVCGGAGTVAGCTDSTACNYDSTADCDDASCEYVSCSGCTDTMACNYNPGAVIPDPGSCLYLDACGVCGGAGTVAGCTDSTACNYDSTADCDDSSCQYLDACGVCGGAGTVAGCTDSTACNYDSTADCDDSSCQYLDACGVCGGAGTVAGCTDSTACNYDSTADCDDSSCQYLDACGVCGGAGTVAGCTDSTACNYDSTADCDDSSCQYLDACGVCGGAGTVAGCTDSTACNYDSTADCDDASCQYLDACGVCGGAGTTPGCTDSTACNYDSAADCDDSSCQYLDACGVCGGTGTVAGCTDSTACNYDSTADCDDASCTYATCSDPTACNYDPDFVCVGDNMVLCTYAPCTANDVKTGAIELTAVAVGQCVPTLGNLSDAGSIDANANCAINPDLWYKFTAPTGGISVTMGNITFNGTIELQEADGTLIDCEDVNGVAGTEILNAGGLVAGNEYFISVSSTTAFTDGSFLLCVEFYEETTCDYGPGPYDLCDIFKATWIPNTTDYIFNFTPQGGGATLTETGFFFTKIKLRDVAGLEYNTTYDVVIDVTHTVLDGNGDPESIVVPGTVACEMIVGDIPETYMKSIYNCTEYGDHWLGDWIKADPWVCDAQDWEWRFAPAGSGLWIEGNFSGGPINVLQLMTVPGLQMGETYDVQVRAITSSGTGNWGPTECISLYDVIEMAPPSDNDEVADAVKSGTESISEGLQTAIYPNPNNGDLVYVNVANATTDKVLVDVYDVFGKLVYSSQFAPADGQINGIVTFSESLASGIYTVRIADGDQVQTERMVISK